MIVQMHFVMGGKSICFHFTRSLRFQAGLCRWVRDIGGLWPWPRRSFWAHPDLRLDRQFSLQFFVSQFHISFASLSVGSVASFGCSSVNWGYSVDFTMDSDDFFDVDSRNAGLHGVLHGVDSENSGYGFDQPLFGDPDLQSNALDEPTMESVPGESVPKFCDAVSALSGDACDVHSPHGHAAEPMGESWSGPSSMFAPRFEPGDQPTLKPAVHDALFF